MYASSLLMRFLCPAIAIWAFTPALASAQAIIIVNVVNNDFVDNTGLHIDPTITVGDTVRWVWAPASSIHSTTAALGQADFWDSTLRTPPFSFDHTFNQLGTFNYYCIAHGADIGGGNVAGMSGFVLVNAVPEPTSLTLVGLGLIGHVVRRRRRR